MLKWKSWITFDYRFIANEISQEQRAERLLSTLFGDPTCRCRSVCKRSAWNCWWIFDCFAPNGRSCEYLGTHFLFLWISKYSTSCGDFLYFLKKFFFNFFYFLCFLIVLKTNCCLVLFNNYPNALLFLFNFHFTYFPRIFIILTSFLNIM